MKKLLIAVLIIFLITSCRKKQESNLVSISQITTNYDTLIHRVKNQGNIEAYDELYYGFMDSNTAERTDSLMIYSRIMAEKFKYEKAYFDYFQAFGEKHNVKIDFGDYSTIDISKMDKVSRKEAKDWLKYMVCEKVMTQQQFDSIKK
jgi:hypothetical protein